MIRTHTELKYGACTIVCLAILLVLFNSLPAQSANSKKGANKASSKPAEKTDKSPDSNLKEYVKAKWKEVQFFVYNKEKNLWDMHIVKIGETLQVPDTDLKVYVKEALVNPSQPQNAAVNIVAYRDNREIYSGLVYQSFPRINPFEKSGYGGYKGFDLRFITGHPSIQLNTRLNNLLTDKDGKLYLFYKNSLYYKIDESAAQWGRSRENVNSFAVNPIDKNIFYSITTQNSVQKSMDGGNTWLTINNGLPSNVAFLDVIINTHNPQEVFILSSAGLFKTNDAGFSWEQTSLRDIVYQLLIDPNEKSTYYARTNSGLYISKNSGSTWSNINDSLPKRVVKGKGRTAEKLPIIVKAITFLSFDKPSLLALTEDNGILKSEDNGITWREFNNGFDKDDGAYSILTTSSGTYIGSYGCIYYLNGASEKWTKIDLGKSTNPPTSITGIYYLPQADTSFIITDATGKIMYVNPQRNLIGLNYGVMPHSKIVNVANATVDGKFRVYAFVQNTNFTDIGNYGLFYSEDNGTSWKPSLTYAKPYYGGNPRIFISPHDSKEIRVLERGDDEAKYWTKDGGNNWSIFDKPAFSTSTVYDFVYDPIDKNTIYMCKGTNGSWLFKYKASQEAGKWLSLNVNAETVIVNRDDNNKLLTNNLNMSIDGGWTWNNLSKNIKTELSNSVIPVFFKGKHIVLVSKFGNALDILESSDMGDSWSTVGHIRDKHIHLFYASPNDHANMLTVSDNAEYGNEKPLITVSESQDKGLSWKSIYSYQPTNNDDYRNYNEIINTVMVTNDQFGQAIYLGGRYGLKRSYDHGANWETIGGIKLNGR